MDSREFLSGEAGSDCETERRGRNLLGAGPRQLGAGPRRPLGPGPGLRRPAGCQGWSGTPGRLDCRLSTPLVRSPLSNLVTTTAPAPGLGKDWAGAEHRARQGPASLVKAATPRAARLGGGGEGEAGPLSWLVDTDI